MKISDLMLDGKPRKGLALKVRVPAKLQQKLGTVASGTFMSMKKEGRAVRVTVEIGGKKHVFRPQDLSTLR